jgi:hypothetical protein
MGELLVPARHQADRRLITANLEAFNSHIQKALPPPNRGRGRVTTTKNKYTKILGATTEGVNQSRRERTTIVEVHVNAADVFLFRFR